ncbi:MAG: flagellar biosynthetic protein FliO [Candidatus Kapabacteria bacterium]|nr:flagellar biosynthetic protein FliO [Candidatus Kapabacteria bacterium]
MDNSLITSFLTLFAMAGGLIAVMLIVKRLILKNKSINSNLELKILSRLPLRQKSSLYVVKVGTRTILIGASDQNIRAIADITTEFNKNSSSDSVSKNPQSITRQTDLVKSESDLSFSNFIKSAFKRQRN